MIDPELVKRVLDLAVEIQQIPAPTFNESQRAEHIRQRFLSEELQSVEIDKIGNVIGCFQGSGKGLPIVVSAHLDTVFPLDTDLHVVRETEIISGPGIGDNSIGLAGLFGLLWSIKKGHSALKSDLWLVANVGEEGLGNLRGMRAIVDHFGDQPKAYLILEGMALGQIYHRGLGVHRSRITVKTAGGHSWVNYGKPSAVHELAGVINRLLAIPIPDQPRTTINIGSVSGGTSVNTIAAEAYLVLDLRSEDANLLKELIGEVEDAALEVQDQEIAVSVETVGERPVGAISANHLLVRLAKEGLEAVGVQPHLNIGSTDANVPLSKGFPAICLGLTTGDGAHSKDEFIHTAPLEQGLQQLLYVIEGLEAS